MGRHLSHEQKTAFISEWRSRLLAANAAGSSAADRASRLRATIAGPLAQPDPKRAEGIATAVKALLSVLDRGKLTSSANAVIALDAWIERHLLSRGDSLLTTELERTALLSRCRDRRRRQIHNGRDLHSTRIEVARETLGKLKALRFVLGFKSLGEGFGKAVDVAFDKYHDQVIAPRKPRRRRLPSGQAMLQASLLPNDD